MNYYVKSCSVCGANVKVRTDGTLAYHSVWVNPNYPRLGLENCPGSRKEPQDTPSTGGEVGDPVSTVVVVSTRVRVEGVADVSTYCGPVETHSRSRVRISLRLEPDLVDDKTGEADLDLEQAEDLVAALNAAVLRSTPA